jgi:hypothetical protein
VTRPRASDALLVGAAKLVTSAFVLATGFRAVSDDDYARIVIAQRFAENPSVDPSGTSWLPVPFWTYGGVFSLFGASLEVARTTALVLGVASALLVLVAASWLGANRAGALLAAIVAGVFPLSAWLGAATLPEAPTAGLIVLAVASLSREDPVPRWLGAAALWLACFSRYEAWPVAAVFGFLSAVDARRLRTWRLAVPAFVALLPIALWLAHGVVRHDDALFFFRRVASYKQALGDSASAWGAWLPLAALLSEPVLLLFVALALVRRLRRGASLAPYARGLACAAALVLFLLAGAVGGGTPTHHGARALLPVFYFLACVLGHASGNSVRTLGRNPIVLLVAVAGCSPLVLPRSDFAHRELELHIGTRARSLGAPALLVDAADYGYLAVCAAFQRPNACAPLDDRDPRKKRLADAFESPKVLRGRLSAAPNAWLVATDAHAARAAALGAVRARNAGFTLLEPDRSKR